MPTKPIDRLLFAQGGRCFFCQKNLPPAEASVEHLVATVNGGGNGFENTVACCKALNSLFGRMSIKEKMRVVLNQKGAFKCPNGASKPKKPGALPSDAYSRALADLKKRGAARPRSVKTLTSTISGLFQGQLSPEQTNSIVGKLKATGVVKINDSQVTYSFDADA